MRLKALRPLVWVLFGACVGVLATFELRALAREARATIPLEQLQQLANVFGMVKQDYVEPVDEKKLIGDAINGLVAGLDPHSQYLDEKAYKEFREGTSGRFVGIGIEIGAEDGFVKVIAPIEDTPAFKGGLKAGDLITKVDDTNAKGMAIDEVVKRIRGTPGSKVTLSILRKSEDRSFTLTLTREEIQQRSVKSKLVEPGYGWLRISQFQERSVSDLVKQINDLYRQSDNNLKGLVLDLRNDPGGLLEAAVATSAVFLPADVAVVSTKGQIPESNQVYKATPQDYLRGQRNNNPLDTLPAGIKSVPLVVLVNEGSASASEIVAGALQDYKRATIIGHRTFGKGSVQTIRNITNNTALKLTTARYYTPTGRSIQAVGITPNLLVDEYADGDPLAVLRTREADLSHQIGMAGMSGSASSPEAATLQKERDAVRKMLENEKSKAQLESRKPVRYGEADDFMLKQGLNHLKGLPVVLSKSASTPEKS